MKKLCIITLMLLAGMSAHAQLAGGKITINDLNVVEADNTVTVSFTAVTDKKTVTSNVSYLLLPVLTDDCYRVSLPAFVVEGKRAMRSREYRTPLTTEQYDNAIFTSNNQTVNYSATVEAQDWMNGGRLFVEGASFGCCNYSVDADVVLADKLHLRDEPVSIPTPLEVVTEVVRFAPKTVGDSLSVIFPFVLPETMFDPNDPFRIYDEERENSLVIYFRQSKNGIDMDYLDNGRTLVNLTAAVTMIMADTRSEVKNIVIAGFASPEGSFEVNDRLAFNRAVTVKHHLLQTTRMQDQQVLIHNGSADWKGLRVLVEQSNMEYKQEVLNIIDNTPVWDSKLQVGRLGKLQKLAGGKPYWYMHDKMFPLLRNGAFIKVYYKNK